VNVGWECLVDRRIGLDFHFHLGLSEIGIRVDGRWR
jgi:hypothetical protein